MIIFSIVVFFLGSLWLLGKFISSLSGLIQRDLDSLKKQDPLQDLVLNKKSLILEKGNKEFLLMEAYNSKGLMFVVVYKQAKSSVGWNNNPKIILGSINKIKGHPLKSHELSH